MSIKSVKWSSDAARVLATALNARVLPLVADEVQRGVSVLWLCETARHRAYIVTRLDGPPKEWVIVAVAGSGLFEFARVFIAASERIGVPIRIHTQSEMLARVLAKRWKFGGNEFVLRRAA